jgi:mevalonate kinase
MDCQKNSSTLKSLSFPVSGGCIPALQSARKKNGPGEAKLAGAGVGQISGRLRAAVLLTAAGSSRAASRVS